jgi:hypothetical protein
MAKLISKGEILMAKHLKELGLKFCRHYRFYSKRKWEFDFALMSDGPSIAIEVEGGTWGKGRHSYGKGFERDCLKYNTATLLGYRVLRFSTQMVEDGSAKDFLKEWLQE